MNPEALKNNEKLALIRPITGTNFVLLGMLFVAFLLAYFPVWKSLVLAWHGSEDYSHGFFIVPISLYIVRQKLYVLLSKYTRKREDNAFVRVTVPMDKMGEKEAYEVGVRFIEAFYPVFLDYVRQGNGSR